MDCAECPSPGPVVPSGVRELGEFNSFRSVPPQGEECQMIAMLSPVTGVSNGPYLRHNGTQWALNKC